MAKKPQIRFKGHQDEWKDRVAGEVCDLKNGYPFKSSTYSKRGNYKVVTIANVLDGQFTTTECNKVADIPEDIQQHQVLKQGDLLMSMTGNVGRVCKVTEDNCLLNQRVGLLDVFPNYSIDFFEQLLKLESFHKFVKVCAQGAAQANIGKRDFEGFSSMYPSTDEQQKIGEFFKTLDELIGAKEEELEKLRQLKAALLEQMFPSEENNHGVGGG